jgi:hypothetical protein
MMPSRLRASLIITEAVLCFALPTYMVVWWVTTAPAFYFAWLRGGSYAAWNVVYALGGCLGIASMVAFVRYLTSAQLREFSIARNVALGLLGIGSIWAFVTEHFTHADVGLFGLVLAAPPTICLLHFLTLTFGKRRFAT